MRLDTEDIDEIGHLALQDPHPMDHAARLVDAVQRGLLADQADTAYALSVAAEITAQSGDLPAAEGLAARAVEASREYGGRTPGYTRAYHAELLLRLGREDEAMARLAALRPLLTSDVDAVHYLTDVLVECGHRDVAERWLTAALEPVLWERDNAPPDPGSGELSDLASRLLWRRRHLRRDLELPPDGYDHEADELWHARMQERQPAPVVPLPEDPVAVLFWPEQAFDRLVRRWPALTGDVGSDWEQHRTRVEQRLVEQSQSSATRRAVFACSVDGLVRHAEDIGADPTDEAVQQSYARSTLAAVAWPPARNTACWCGSGHKYKQCCLPRTRR